MKLSNPFKEALRLGVVGAKIAALLSLGYYLFAVTFMALFIGIESGELWSFTPILAVFQLLLMGLIVGVPISLAAISLGFVTGIAVPKLLAVIEPSTQWQSALVGTLFSGAIALGLLWLLGFPSEIILMFEIPLVIYVATTTYIAVRLHSNKDAARDVLSNIQIHPLVLWALAVVLMSLMLYVLNMIAPFWN